MSKLTTDFNINPYYDDYDENKNFHRVLFKPSVAIQARELTQLQTILQNQVSRFGDNIYKEGTIIDGCSITYDQSYNYVKILDLTTGGAPVAPSTYIGLEARGTVSNVYAVVNAYADGLLSQDPNLTTLYVHYTKTGQSEAKKFNASETIGLYNTSTNTLVATVTAGGASVNNAVGSGFAVRTTSGIIYSKGHFVRVDSGQVLASKYDTTPSGVSVGFNVSETIVTSEGDTTLLDNASGYNNENAPGADRLKLTPYLVAIPTKQALANSNFLALIDFQQGLPVVRRTDTQFNSITNELAKRTSEESGDYSVVTNSFDTEAIAANTTHFNLMLGPGLHYVNGYRAEQLNTTRVAVPKARNYANATGTSVSTNMGQYVVIDELVGQFNPHLASEVSLRDTAQNAITDSDTVGTAAAGNEIGKANVKAMLWDEGAPGTANGRFRLYLFNIRMNTGKKFANVRSVYLSSTGHADIVLTNGKAVIKEPNQSINIFPLQKTAVKSTTNSDYIFRTKVTQNFSAATGTFSSAYDLPYSGTLTNAQKREWTVIPSTNDASAGWTAGEALNTDLIGISVSGTNISVDLTSAISSSLGAAQDIDVIYNAKKSSATPLVKTLKTAYVQLNTSNATNTTTGPWSLGLPDVISIEGVYKWSNGSSVNSTSESWMSDITTSFDLNVNQYDNFYGLSELQKKPSLSLSAGDKLLVKVKVFDSSTPASGVGFYTVNSYVESDGATAVSPSTIPVYTSPQTGVRIDLRNVLDCRPQVAKTASVVTTTGGVGSTVNPADTQAFSGSELFMAAPNQTFSTDLEYYLPRQDRIVITQNGAISIRNGVPSTRPAPPSEPTGTMTIGIMSVPPYPSLTSKEATATADRQGESISITPVVAKRYTMQDIQKIDKRLKNIEYYTTLTMLEQKTDDMVITDENGNDRFKNGIFVDSGLNFTVSDIKNREFRIGLDSSAGEFVPKFSQFFCDLQVNSVSSAVSLTNPGETTGTFTLPAVEELIIRQTAATTAVPCTENFYKYNGKVYITPYYDGGYDTENLPSKTVTVDTTTGADSIVDNFNSIYSLTQPSMDLVSTDLVSTDSVVTGSSTETNYNEEWSYNYGWHNDYWYGSNWDYYDSYGGKYGRHYGYYDYGWDVSGGTATTTVTTTTATTDTYVNTYQATTQQLVRGEDKVTTQQLGDFVTDISFSPFMRSKVIKFVGTGFKKNTRHWVFFDETDVSQYVRPGIYIGTKNNYANDPLKVRAAGALGGTITSDSSGRVFGTFAIPESTFYVGERKLLIMDVSSMANKADATSMGSESYNAYNYSVSKQNVSISTKSPTYSVDTKIETISNTFVNTYTSSNTSEVTTNYIDGWTGNNYYYTSNSTWDYGYVANNFGTNVVSIGANTANTYTGQGTGGNGTNYYGSGGYDIAETYKSYYDTTNTKYYNYDYLGIGSL